MSFRLSFHLALLGPTGAHWLDDPPDLSCKENTRQHAVDDPRLSCRQLLRRWPIAASEGRQPEPPARAAQIDRHSRPVAVVAACLAL
jgi:hypothetical protein